MFTKRLSHVLRGGAFYDFAYIVRGAVRGRLNPVFRYYNRGFRVVVSPKPAYFVVRGSKIMNTRHKQNILRGGAYLANTYVVRGAVRTWDTFDFSNVDCGFRVVVSPRATHHVLRGASCRLIARDVRAASRYGWNPSDRHHYWGFRAIITQRIQDDRKRI